MSDPLRVLLVEDQETDAKLVLQALRRLDRLVEHERVEDAAAMRAALAGKQWDLILSDWSMPKFSGMAALSVMKELQIDLPFIIVSGTVGEEAAVDAMRAGAHDYVLKDKLARLAPAVERELRDAANRSAQRQAEEELRAQEARFRALIEKSHEGVLLTAADGRLLYMSPAGRRLVGAVDSPSVNSFDFVHPDDRARIAELRAKIRDQPNASVTIEFRAVLPDGSIRWLESVGTNLLHEPAIGAFVANFRDVTERKQAVEALRLSEARFARLADSGIIGIVLADVNGKVLEANDAYLQMIGYSREELLAGKVNWSQMTPPEWQAGDERAVAQLKSEGVASPWEKEMFRKDGSRVPVLLGVAMLDYPNVVTFCADLTERKRAEAALRRSEEQLRQSQKMEAVGRLAGGVAHDFNNVLSVILSYTALLIEDTRGGDPMRDDLAEIKKAAERAANLTRQLLLFSRQQIFEPKVLDLNDLLIQMDKMLHRLVGEDVDLFLSPARSLGRVKIDPGHVEQVVMNLVVNARDAMSTGGKLTIETENVVLDEEYARQHVGVKPGAYVMLAVNDTGAGMDKATQTRIFEPFFTTKGVGKGTGLGLSTVFGIVQQNHGSIWVYSEPGKGSTFKVYLPRVDEEVDAVKGRAFLTVMRGSETILLVEDEEQVRAVARGILRRNGYQVIEAANPGEALLLCESYQGLIHLLLTDVVMPHMSGPELAKRLSAVRPDMRVLCMSGYTDDSVVRHGVLESHMAFIQKPFTPESLTTKVREVLDRG